jgi:transcription antitermination factor NusG
MTSAPELVATEEELSWYALRVRSNSEFTVGTLLRSKGIEEFVPTYKLHRRWSDRVKELPRPLFAGYVFCRMDVNNRLPVLMTSGVVNIVGAGKQPLPISASELQAVRRILDSKLLASPWPWVRVGERVEIIRGPLAGVTGTLCREKSHLRLVISISLLQRSVAVEIDRDWVRPVSSIAALLSQTGRATVA